MSSAKNKANKPVKEFSDAAIKVAVWLDRGDKPLAELQREAYALIRQQEQAEGASRKPEAETVAT